MSELLRNTILAMAFAAMGAAVAYPVGWRAGWNGARKADEAKAAERALERPHSGLDALRSPAGRQ